MKIADFTKPEIDFLLSMCNFTNEEEMLFHMRCKNIPLEECAERLNVSIATAKRWNKKIKNKIIRVL
jgi:transposase